jgi:pullulanase/glycogen debranching enzyme
LSTDTLWYKDAVFYDLHAKAFQDSSNDGGGDFDGLIQRLDYVAGLGVDVTKRGLPNHQVREVEMEFSIVIRR